MRQDARVGLLDAVQHPLEGEAILEDLAATVSEAGPQVWVAYELRHRVGQPEGVTDVDHSARRAVLDLLGDPACVVRHDRQPGAHRLEHGQREAFPR